MAATGARGRCMKRLIPLCLLLLACAGCVRMHVYGDPQAYAAGAGDTLRIATYNASLHDDAAGGLVWRLASGARAPRRTAPALHSVPPDLLLTPEVAHATA